MYRKTIDELQEDTRDKQIIDLRSEEDFEKETYPGEAADEQQDNESFHGFGSFWVSF